MKEWKKQCFLLIAALLLAIPQPSSAQFNTATPEPTETQSVASSNDVEMADVLRQDGKIYVVVAVILLIFSGLIVYIVRIDRKVSRLEKELS